MNTKAQFLKTLIREEVKRQLQEFNFKDDSKPDFLNRLLTQKDDAKPAEKAIDAIAQDDSIMKTLKRMQGTSQRIQFLIKFAEFLGLSKSTISRDVLKQMLSK